MLFPLSGERIKGEGGRKHSLLGIRHGAIFKITGDDARHRLD